MSRQRRWASLVEIDEDDEAEALAQAQAQAESEGLIHEQESKVRLQVGPSSQPGSSDSKGSPEVHEDLLQSSHEDVDGLIVERALGEAMCSKSTEAYQDTDTDTGSEEEDWDEEDAWGAFEAAGAAQACLQHLDRQNTDSRACAHVVFVLDTSGSMKTLDVALPKHEQVQQAESDVKQGQGKKARGKQGQGKKAQGKVKQSLRTRQSRLNAVNSCVKAFLQQQATMDAWNDIYSLITFSLEGTSHFTCEPLDAAQSYFPSVLHSLQPRKGTNFHAGLEKAVQACRAAETAMPSAPGQHLIIFLSDGRPADLYVHTPCDKGVRLPARPPQPAMAALNELVDLLGDKLQLHTVGFGRTDMWWLDSMAAIARGRFHDRSIPGGCLEGALSSRALQATFRSISSSLTATRSITSSALGPSCLTQRPKRVTLEPPAQYLYGTLEAGVGLVTADSLHVDSAEVLIYSEADGCKPRGTACIEFRKRPFAEGAQRLAYHMFDSSRPVGQQHMVAKPSRFMEQENGFLRLLPAIKCVAIAKEYAQRFNAALDASDWSIPPLPLPPKPSAPAKPKVKLTSTAAGRRDAHRAAAQVPKAVKRAARKAATHAAQLAAKQAAAHFHSEVHNHHILRLLRQAHISILDCEVYKFERESLHGIPFGPGTTHVYVPAEPFLHGCYTKYNGNDGYVAYEPQLGNSPVTDLHHQLAQSFSHYTHHVSGGSLLVCDIQGVGTTYTDPQVNSVDKAYGRSDMGQEGINKFLLTHRCNSVCKCLGLPAQ